MAESLHTDSLIGRESELARIQAVLDRRQPAVIVVTGRVGVGKSVLLNEVTRRASELGWNAAHGDAEGKLRIAPTTHASDFCAQVSRLLHLVEDEIDPVAVGQRVPDKTQDPAEPEVALFRALAAKLRQAARIHPILVTMDFYQPSAPTDRAFASGFIQEIRKGGSPVIVLLADRRRDSSVDLDTDEAITVEAPMRTALEQYFRQFAKRLDPPMKRAELEAYVKAVRQNPEDIDRITALLELIAVPDNSAMRTSKDSP